MLNAAYAVLENFVPLDVAVDNLLHPLFRPPQNLRDLSQRQARHEEAGIEVGVQPFPPQRAVRAWGETMCNLYSQKKGQAAIREVAHAMRDLTGNLPPLPAIWMAAPWEIARDLQRPPPAGALRIVAA